MEAANLVMRKPGIKKSNYKPLDFCWVVLTQLDRPTGLKNDGLVCWKSGVLRKHQSKITQKLIKGRQEEVLYATATPTSNLTLTCCVKSEDPTKPMVARHID